MLPSFSYFSIISNMVDSFIMVWVTEIAWDEPLLDVMDDCGLQWIQPFFLNPCSTP